jgi:hypothetical protein
MIMGGSEGHVGRIRGRGIIDIEEPGSSLGGGMGDKGRRGTMW